MSLLIPDWTPLGRIQTNWFQPNMKCLWSYKPHVWQRVQECLDREDIVIRSRRPDDIEIRHNLPDGRSMPIYDSNSPDAQYAALFQKARKVIADNSGLLFCFGVGSGEIPLFTVEAIDKTDRCLVILERDPAYLLCMLNLFDLAPVIPLSHIFWIVGEEDMNRSAEVLAGNGLFMQWGGAAFRGGKPRSNEELILDERLLEHLVTNLRKLNRDHQERVCKVAEIYPPGGGRSLKKILIVDMWQGVAGGRHLQCLKRAFESKGIEVFHQHVPRTGWAMKTPGHVRRMSGPFLGLLEKVQPDLVFTMQLFGHRLLADETINRIHIPWITYVSSHNDLELKVAPREYVVMMEEAVTRRQHARGYPRIRTVPLAETISDRSIPAPPWPLGELSLTFLGSNYMPPEPRMKDFTDKFAKYPGLLDFLNDLAREMAKLDTFISVYDVIERYVTEWELSADEQNDAQIYVDLIGTGLRRLQLIRALLDEGIRVFGYNWEQDLTREEMERCQAGPIDIVHEENLYIHSAINLNIHSCANEHCPNHRFFNVQAAGGFQLTDDRLDYGRFFAPDREIVFYRSLNELREAVARYRKDPDARRAIAEAGQARALKEHTYLERIDAFMQIAREAVSGAAG